MHHLLRLQSLARFFEYISILAHLTGAVLTPIGTRSYDRPEIMRLLLLSRSDRIDLADGAPHRAWRDQADSRPITHKCC